MIPMFKANCIYGNDYVQGYLCPPNLVCKHHSIGVKENKTVCYYEIDIATLEISDGNKWRKVSECHFRTDYEMDMHLRDGYSDGWNSALSEIQTTPNEKFKSMSEQK